MDFDRARRYNQSMLIRDLPLDRVAPPGPPEALTALHRRGALHRVTYASGEEGWLVTEQALARSVLTDRRFRTSAPASSSGVREGSPRRPRPGMFIQMDPPDHTRLRRKLAAAFTRRHVSALEPVIAEIVDERIDAIEAAGPPVDLVEHFALPVPSLVICELLGVTAEHRDQFQRDSALLLDLDVLQERRGLAFRAIESLLLRLVVEKRADPGDDMLSALAADGDLTVREAAGMGALMLIAGHETTANMFALSVYALLRHPERAAALREADDGGAAGVEELLRYLSIVQLGLVRVAGEDVELRGEVVRAGERVTVSVLAANHDATVYERPERLDFEREPFAHLAFGHGLHQCAGRHLARLELRIGLRRLLERLDGLEAAVPAEAIRSKTRAVHYGVAELPVRWRRGGR